MAFRHPSRTQFPTNSMILGACISRDIAERTPPAEQNLLSHQVECLNPDSPSGQRNWIVCFQYEDGSSNSYDGRNWTPKKMMS